MIAFLLILLILFKIFFGFEKDNHRYIKDIIINLVIYLLTFFILYYLLGIVITFVRNNNYLTWYGFKIVVLKVILNIVLLEFLRYQVLNKCEGSKISIILSIIVFLCLDLTNVYYHYKFTDKFSVFVFFALYVLPYLGKGFLATYLDLKVGYKPVVFYSLVTELYLYLLPILPNPSKYLASVINLGLPLIILYKTYSFFKKERDEDIIREYNKRSISFLLVSLVITIILVYFSSGYFHYHTIAVATGSMNPVIEKGDVVVIEKIDKKYSSLKVGDVIAYKYNNVIIVHRIIKIVYDRNEYYFYTKGDANKKEDNWVVKQGTIEGTVNTKIPYIGYPTVWVNEL